MTEKTKYFSYKTGCPAKGCLLCVKGSKLVLFVTGLCSKNCYYCPLSEEKKNKDVIFANEWRIKNDEDILKEAKLCDAEGAGITGGDPLLKLERTINYIKMLKKEFGKRFHIHLYTMPESIDENNLKKLHEAGLDEIRLHPDLDDDKNWKKISLLKNFDWSTGIEIPSIPGKQKQTEKLIEYVINLKLDFININELEISDLETNSLSDLGFKAKDELSYAVLGSEELALELLKKYGDRISMYFCTSKLKDSVQLAKRIMKRAKNIKKKYDKLTIDGTLIRGSIYLESLKPSFGYYNKIQNISDNEKQNILKELEIIKSKLIRELKIPESSLDIDEVKLRLLTSKKIVEMLSNKLKKLNLVPAIVEEYPTWDQMEITVDFL
ncbi:MAG: radical SAM protein [Candidatus Nanoarchaeia archaeon]|nr:radical SAM protein [Candidatus Nanoarchaeia archaeon]